VSGDLLIEAELTADYADVADNPAGLNLETRKPRRNTETMNQESRNPWLTETSTDFADLRRFEEPKEKFLRQQ
jgi:hypothetical protein